MNNSTTEMNIFNKACSHGWDYIKDVCSPNTDTKEFINYWLNGTATKDNWFDKACSGGWDYTKNVCSPSTDTKELINYWLNGTATKDNWFDKACSQSWDYIKNMYGNTPVINSEGACKELVVTCEAQVDYFSSSLCWLVIVCAILIFIYNFDLIKAIYTCIDIRLYDILCMFDYPGFMVNKDSIMPLWGRFGLRVMHRWFFLKDPADNNFSISHVARYTLDHEYFFIDFRHPLLWSVPNRIELTLIPHLHWPFNYDHFHYITLWSAY